MCQINLTVWEKFGWLRHRRASADLSIFLVQMFYRLEPVNPTLRWGTLILVTLPLSSPCQLAGQGHALYFPFSIRFSADFTSCSRIITEFSRERDRLWLKRFLI